MIYPTSELLQLNIDEHFYSVSYSSKLTVKNSEIMLQSAELKPPLKKSPSSHQQSLIARNFQSGDESYRSMTKIKHDVKFPFSAELDSFAPVAAIVYELSA